MGDSEVTVHLDGLPEFRLLIWQLKQLQEAMERDLAYLDLHDPARALLLPHYDALEAAVRRFSDSKEIDG